MLRLAVFLILVVAAAAGLAWLADRPGEMLINWEGYQVQVSVFTAVVSLAMLIGLSILSWSIFRGIWQSPASIGSFFNRRREKRGLEALSSGMIAIGAGDRALATRYAIQARKSLPNEPMTHLLRAQAARLSGDQTTARRIFEAMLSSPDTEQLGLRGLFLEAEKEGEREAAKQFAVRALKLNPKLAWPVDALLGIQCKEHDWAGALQTLGIAKKHGHIEKSSADRKRAVLLTAQAQAKEDSDPERAMNLALEAHNLAPDLIAAAAIAGRLLAARGSTPKAVKVISKTWKKSPHPDLAVAYAYARLGDSPKDRFERVAKLAAMAPNVIESPIALANAAIEARNFDAARKALGSLISENRLTQRVCTLMARIEGETGNAGGVREWLARAVHAPRDPAWTADGMISEDWAAVSPVTGALDAYQWRVPVEAAEPRSKDLLVQKMEELVKVGVLPESMIAASTAAVSEPDAATSSPAVPPTSTVAAKQVSGRSSNAEDAEVVQVVKVVSAEKPAMTVPATQSSSKPSAADRSPASGANAGMKVIELPARAEDKPADSASNTGAAAGIAAAPSALMKNGHGSGHDNRRDAEMRASSTAAVKAVEKVSAAAPRSGSVAEPKIFISPRAPDDPGPISNRKK